MNAGDPFEWYTEIPIVSRVYLTLSFVTTAACALDLISPFSLYFNYKLIVEKGQVWRLFTNFFFFGMFSVDFLFHMYFLVRYSRLLEDGYFRGRTADFVFMLLIGAVSMLTAAPFINVQFLGSSLTFMSTFSKYVRYEWYSHSLSLAHVRTIFASVNLTSFPFARGSSPVVYVWGQRNPLVRMSFLGLFPFTAPYLPWVLFSFSVMLGNNATIDLMGIAVGHAYFYFDEILPQIAEIRSWRLRKFIRTPSVLTHTIQPQGNF